MCWVTLIRSQPTTHQEGLKEGFLVRNVEDGVPAVDDVKGRFRELPLGGVTDLKLHLYNVHVYDEKC